jgi:hypothetical protein
MPNWLIIVLVAVACSAIAPAVLWVDGLSRGDPKATRKAAGLWRGFFRDYVSWLLLIAGIVAMVCWLAS